MHAISQSDMATPSSLGQITRSKTPVTLLVAASGFMVLGTLFLGLAHALLGTKTLSASQGLLTAGGWLEVVATIGGLGAVCVVGWYRIVAQDWSGLTEFAAAALSSLLVTIGFVVAASALPRHSESGWIVAAVGLGGWMLLALVNAGRCSIQEQAAPVGRQSDLWLSATAGLLALAVATGLPSPSTPGQALPIAEDAVFVVAWVVLALTIDIARHRGYLGGRGEATLVVGLAVLAAGFLTGAVANGFVFSSSATLTTYRVGLSVPEFVQALGWAVVAFAAFQRLAQLKLDTGVGFGAFLPGGYDVGSAPTGPLAYQPNHPMGERMAPSEHCGVPLPPEAIFCPRCGQRVKW
jgi:hypothetical protein